MKRRIHVIVHGRVQGVFFRAAVRDTAVREEISGWVRNLPSGPVEAVFEGESPAIDQMIDFCRSGPRYARVDHLDLAEEPYTGEFDGFTIRYG
jgi:acylphosphatase